MILHTRKRYIDNLRWLMLLMLIPYHTAQAWNTWGEPNYVFFEGNRAISSIIVFFSPYFMPLLFLLAGISTKYSLQKRTNREYLVERIKRLLVPFLFETIVFMPIMSYIGDKFNYSYDEGFLKHYAVFFTKFTDLTGADGGFSVGQFWFLLYLLIISILSVGIIELSKKVIPKPEETMPFWLVLALGLPLPLFSEWLSIGGKSLVEYTYFFLLGYYVFTNEKITWKLENNRWFLFSIGLAASILNVYLFLWTDEASPFIYTFAVYASKWVMVLALLGLAKRYLNFTGKVSKYMNERSFLFYIYHFIWLVSFQYLLYGAIGNKTCALFIGALLLSYTATFVCCEISIRIPVLCFLTGTKYRPKKRLNNS